MLKYVTNQLNPKPSSNNISTNDYNYNIFVLLVSDVIRTDLQNSLLKNISCAPHSFAFIHIIEADAIMHLKRFYSCDMYHMKSNLAKKQKLVPFYLIH